MSYGISLDLNTENKLCAVKVEGGTGEAAVKGKRFLMLVHFRSSWREGIVRTSWEKELRSGIVTGDADVLRHPPRQN